MFAKYSSMWVFYLPVQSVISWCVCGSAWNCQQVSLSVAGIYIFQFKLFSQSLTTRARTCGGAAAELARTDPARQSNESLAAAPRSTSNHLLMWKRNACFICFGWIWIQASAMLIMYCGNWSRAPYQQRESVQNVSIKVGNILERFKNIIRVILCLRTVSVWTQIW